MDTYIIDGINFLRENDVILKGLIDRNELCNLKLSDNYFNDLTYSIISQQLSVKAANSIFNRLILKLNSLSPISIDNLDPQDLQDLGLSKQKARSVKELANFFLMNEELIKKFPNQTDEEVINELCKINGIGIWTAQMFLIFSLSRLNILPLADIGFKRSVIKNYNFPNDEKLTENIIKISENWGQYKSIAVWYLWKDLDTI